MLFGGSASGFDVGMMIDDAVLHLVQQPFVDPLQSGDFFLQASFGLLKQVSFLLKHLLLFLKQVLLLLKSVCGVLKPLFGLLELGKDMVHVAAEIYQPIHLRRRHQWLHVLLAQLLHQRQLASCLGLFARFLQSLDILVDVPKRL